MDKVQYPHINTTDTLYVHVRNGLAEIWNGTTLETFDSGNLDSYDIALSGQPNNYYITTFPSGIPAGSYNLIVYKQIGSGVALDDLRIGGGAIAWGGDAFVSIDNVYYADIDFIKDGAIDEYSVSWFKNGVPLESGVVSATLQVIKRTTGNLIDESSMTDVGSNFFTFDVTGVSGTTIGESYLAQVKAAIDGATRTWRKIIGRDN